MLQRALAQQIGDLRERAAQRHRHQRLPARRDDARELLEQLLALGRRRQRMHREAVRERARRERRGLPFDHAVVAHEAGERLRLRLRERDRVLRAVAAVDVRARQRHEQQLVGIAGAALQVTDPRVATGHDHLDQPLREQREVLRDDVGVEERRVLRAEETRRRGGDVTSRLGRFHRPFFAFRGLPWLPPLPPPVCAVCAFFASSSRISRAS